MRGLLVVALLWSLVPEAAFGQVVNGFRISADPQEIACKITSFLWNSVTSPPAAGIKEFRLYRDGVKVNTQSSPTGRSANDNTWLERGQVYQYTVRVVDLLGVEYGNSAPLAVTAPPCPPQPALLVTRFFRINFSDRTPVDDGVSVYERFFLGDESISGYFLRMSKGGQFLSGLTANAFDAAYTLPYPFSHYCPGSVCTPELGQGIRALIDPGYDFTNVDRVAFVLGAYDHAGGAAGFVTDEGLVKAIYFSRTPSVQVGVHEFGHHLNGTGHSASVTCPDGSLPPDLFNLESGGCTTYTYGDDKDPMGGSVDSADIDFSVIHQERMGFIEPSEILVVTPGSVGVDYVLTALEKTGGTKALKIPVGNAGFIYVEYHKSASTNAVFVRLKPGFANAAGLYRPTKGKLNLIDDKFDDPVRNLRVRLITKNGTTAKVRVKTLTD